MRGGFSLKSGTRWRRVTWPTRREVYATTLVVILTSIFFGLYLWGIDMILNSLMRWIYSTFGVA